MYKLEVRNGSMQWERIHTMIGLTTASFFEKLILVNKHFHIINSNILLLIYLPHSFKTACKSWTAEMV